MNQCCYLEACVRTRSSGLPRVAGKAATPWWLLAALDEARIGMGESFSVEFYFSLLN